MACSVTETVWTVRFKHIDVLEVDPASSAYPFPPLRLREIDDEVSLSILVIENDLVRAEVAPTLGGRLLSLRRKSDSHGKDIEVLPLLEGGRRGVLSPFGFQISLDGSERLDSLAAADVSFSISEEQDSAQILVGSLGSYPFSFHLEYRIEEADAELALTAKVFNRSLLPASYNAGILAPDLIALDGERVLSGETLISSRDLSLHNRPSIGEGFFRFERPRILSPRQLDTWEAVLCPIGADQDRSLIGDGVEIQNEEGVLRVSVWRKQEGLKLIILNSRDESLEATLTVEPSVKINIPIPNDQLPLKGLVIMSPKRRELLRWPRTMSGEIESNPASPDPVLNFPALGDSNRKLRDTSFLMHARYLSHLLIGLQALKSVDYEEADYEFEQSLLFNGEDHLAWWLKGYAARMLDSESSSGDEILNAHFLAPLEPALRVEAFLGQPIQAGFEENPLLANVASNPEAILDVASQLIEAGRLQDAARFLGEILRSVDRPMIRFLLAYCYLVGSRMEIEAGEQLRTAGTQQNLGPYPVRPIEKLALQFLADRWPNNAQVVYYQNLATVAFPT